jgi:uncharacterized protein (DUF1499 family)
VIYNLFTLMMKLFLRLTLALVLSVNVIVSSAAPAHATPSTTMHLAAIPIISNFFSGTRPDNLGVKDGKLAPCPASPNCVISQGNTDAEHAIAPLSYSGDKAAAMAQLEAIVNGMERTNIIQKTDDYLYAEFASKLMGYVDDVEFYLDPAESVIHVRSASRLGQSDLGVNRQRIEAIRSQLNSAGAA